MIVTLIILGILGWLLVLIMMTRIYRTPEKKENFKVIHISALLDGRVSKLFDVGLLKGTPVVSQDDLELISSKREDSSESNVAKSAMKTIDRLSPDIEEGNFISIARELDAPVIVAGKDVNKIKIRGLNYIDISEIDSIQKGKIFVGQKIRVKNVSYSYNKARGHLEDGSEVEITGELPKTEDLILDCRVQSIAEGNNFRKIHAKWING